MIRVTLDEKNKILARYPHTHFTRTSIQKSSRHVYYLEENKKLLELISDTNEEAREALREMKNY